jgi:hypothetical protein
VGLPGEVSQQALGQVVPSDLAHRAVITCLDCLAQEIL